MCLNYDVLSCREVYKTFDITSIGMIKGLLCWNMSCSKHPEILTFIDKMGLLIGKVLLSSFPLAPFCCGLATKFHGCLGLPLMRSHTLILWDSYNCVHKSLNLYTDGPWGLALCVVPSVSLIECHDSKWMRTSFPCTAAGWVTAQLKGKELLATFEPAYTYVKGLVK